MKEILFRGQTRRYGEKVRMGDGFKLPSRWVYGGVLQGVSAYSIIYGGENADNPGEGLEKWVVYTETVGQFTGCYDSTRWENLTPDEQDIFLLQPDEQNHTPNEWIGKRIFEGDICRVSRPCVIAYGHIEFTNGCFWFIDNGPGGMLRLCDVQINGFRIEVIGNIHDNPELLIGGA